MTIDILSALAATPQRGGNACKLQRILNDIPTETPGRDQLVDAVDNGTAYPAITLTLTFSALGTPASPDLIRDHRAKRCACFR